MLNKMKFVTPLLVSSVLAGLIATSAEARPGYDGDCDFNGKGNMGRHHQRADGMRYAFSQLDLSEEQQTALKSLWQGNQPDRQSLRDSMQTLRSQMKALLSAETIDEGAIKSLSSQIAELKAEQMIRRAKHRQQALALLTEDQRVQLQELKKNRRDRARDRFFD